jgi:hypothetical protein
MADLSHIGSIDGVMQWFIWLRPRKHYNMEAPIAVSRTNELSV